jgi:hypothetical protein
MSSSDFDVVGVRPDRLGSEGDDDGSENDGEVPDSGSESLLGKGNPIDSASEYRPVDQAGIGGQHVRSTEPEDRETQDSSARVISTWYTNSPAEL